jgi:CubicO group peptidase (beta-lactamase class C family)
MNYTRIIAIPLLMITLFSCSASEPKVSQTEEQLDTLRAHIRKSLEATKVPGLGVGIIKDGKVILAEGFGTRDTNTGLPLDSQSIFLIGSSTKPFTTTALAMLVDDGLVDWDAPVRTYVPTFGVHNDDYVSAYITVKDLVTHRTGVPESEVSWMGSTLTRKEMVATIQNANLSVGFREKFQYNNTMFMAAGYVAGQVTTSTYEEVIHDRILEPLGMSRTEFTDLSEEDPPFRDNIAFPHVVEDGSVERIEFEFEGAAIRPAGTLASNIDDMLIWLRFNLNRGKHAGKEFLSESGFQQLVTPHMHISQPRRADAFQNYGLGWFLEIYNGHKVVHHTGGATGTNTQVLFMPDDNIGMVLFTNASSRLPSTLAYYIVDLLTGNARSAS